MVMWAYYEPADPLIGGVGCLKKNTILKCLKNILQIAFHSYWKIISPIFIGWCLDSQERITKNFIMGT